LNSDQKFLNDLIEGLKTNEERFGYPSCPCRLGTGVYEQDRDIICPCDYRDPDVLEYGVCYCSFFVNKKLFEAGQSIPIPERRPIEKSFPELNKKEVEEKLPELKTTERKLFYCKQCGYTVFREEPPYICPICKAKKEYFSEINLSILLKSK